MKLNFRKEHIPFYIIMGLIFLFLIGEVTVRIFDKEDYLAGIYSEINSTYPYPYRVYGTEPFYRSDALNTNSIGLRGKKEYEPETDKYRVIILGGSAVFGYGAISSDENTIPANLEKLLNEKIEGEKFEVINAGQGFYESTSELMFYLTDLLQLKPNLVILLDGFNDVTHSLILREEIGYPVIYPHWKSKLLTLTSKEITIDDIGRPIYKIMRKSKLLNKLILEYFAFMYNKRLYGDVLEKKEEIKYPSNFPAMDKYLDNIQVFSEINSVRQIKTLVLMQPTIFLKEVLSKKEQQYLESNLNTSPYTQKETIFSMYQYANEKLEDLAKKNDFLYYDNINDLLKDEPSEMFSDYAHFTDKGSEIVAQKVLDIINNQNIINYE